MSKRQSIEGQLFEFMGVDNESKVKRCTICKEIKPITMYTKSSKVVHRHRKDGFRSVCAPCRRIEQQKYRSRLPREVLLTRHKGYYQRIKREDPASILYGAAKRRAKIGSLPFDLDYEFVKSRLDVGICELTGWQLQLDAPNKTFYRPSLDQIKARGGYTKANTRLICWGVNWMLGKFGESMLIEIADAIRAHRASQTALRVDSISGS